MVDDKFIMVSMGDSKTKSLADVLGSKTCKKIIDYLAEHDEASQKDLSDALKIPMNTMDYNMKKLLASGLVQKRKNFFWSKKGKKILMYELSNKSIVISPKKSFGEKMKTLVPGFMLAIVGTFAVWVYGRIKTSLEFSKVAQGGDLMNRGIEMDVPSTVNSLYSPGASEGMTDIMITHASDVFQYSPSQTWMYFLAGALLILFAYSIINWRKL
ncbi:MAG TPA: helix-turn-helix domain-containing protein [Candidatus Nanoarchaeia archaeon]|nr:helix-turn-helix domain-containing protein [Candidatus Nanoarchaeia archaeon]